MMVTSLLELGYQARGPRRLPARLTWGWPGCCTNGTTWMEGRSGLVIPLVLDNAQTK
jgi:hypothetical protein